MHKRSVKQEIIENFAFRLRDYHPDASIQIGRGNYNADIVIVQPHVKMPDRDSITGALKRFNMLESAYRATSTMLDYGDESIIYPYPDIVLQGVRNGPLKTQAELNRYYLKELIEILDPLLVVSCGMDATALLHNKKLRSFNRYAGKKFVVTDLPKPVFYGILNPMDYGFSKAPASMKIQGKAEWEKLEKLYRRLKKQAELNRWK